MKRQQRLDRIRQIESEFLVATSAFELLLERLRGSKLGRNQGWRSRDADSLVENAESTYLIRLYAEFESGLRDAWANFFRRPTHPPMRDLLDSIAAHRTIPQDEVDKAHDVRRYRNGLVHDDAEEARVLTLSESKRRLCRYFSRLPLDW